MKKHTLLLLIFISIKVVYGQDTIRTYFDKDWKETKKRAAVYYRKAFSANDGKWIVNDFYKEGTLQMEGVYQTNALKIKEGDFIYYHDNGQIKSKGLYVNDKKEGPWITWHYKGSLYLNENYKNGELHGEYKNFYSNETLSGQGVYKNGHYDGEWNWYHFNGKKSSIEIYENEELKSVTFWNEDGTEEKEDLRIEQQPQFLGEGTVIGYISKNFILTPKQIKRKNKGKIFVQFVVEKDGAIGDVKVVKGINEEMDQLAINVVASMPKWRPGKRHNILCRVRYVVPINIK